MQPQSYNREIDFTERTGDDTDHTGINSELDAAALSINEIRDNIALIQRDDGELANGVVKADSLDPSAFNAVQASVNAATAAAQSSAESALTSAITANNSKDAAVVAKTSAETARDASLLNANSAASSANSALISKNASAASEAAALASKNAAEASQVAAAASATGSSNSAQVSTTQAGISTTKAGEAAASQAAAAASEAAALASKNAAATSEANALSSKNAAAASQTAAAASELTATTKAGEASASATAAAASQADALASKNAAAISEANALSSKNAAATSETNSTAQAVISTAQATISTTKATESAASASDSAASAVSAASSAASAAALLDNFDDRYLGVKASDPSVDNDGDPLQLGALYSNSTTGKMRVYTASGWIDASSASVATLAVFNYTATAGQTSFSGADIASQTLTYTVGSLFVTLNGIDLKNGTDYTATTGSSIVLASGAVAGDELRVYAFGSFLVADTYTRAQVDTSLAAKQNASTAVIKDGNGNVAIGNGAVIATNIPLKVEQPSGTYDTTKPMQRWGYAGVPIVDLYMDGTASPVSNTDSASTYGQPFTMKWQYRGSDRMALDSSGNFAMNSGYGSVATAYGCRAWVNFNGTGTVAIRGSGNVSSITDNGVGNYTVNFATAIVDANYSFALSAFNGDLSSVYSLNGYVSPPSTTQFKCYCYNYGGAPSDVAYTSLSIFR